MVPLRELASFLSGGTLATFTHWLSMAVLIGFGLSDLGATAIGASIGAIVNYSFQFNVTFGKRSRHALALPAFATNAAVNVLLNTILLELLLQASALATAPAQILTTALLTLSNFLLYRKVIFR